VAPDTGLLHLAAALDVPTVGLFAPTSASLVGQRAEHAPARSLQQPLTCTPCLEKRCPYAEALCMAQFKPDQVLAALAGVLPS
jgi:ADP-heptose:LPS heptosyltransferase